MRVARLFKLFKHNQGIQMFGNTLFNSGKELELLFILVMIAVVIFSSGGPVVEGLPGEAGVISGMRKSAEVFVWVDVLRAMRMGVTFYLSQNRVVLTPGREVRLLVFGPRCPLAGLIVKAANGIVEGC